MEWQPISTAPKGHWVEKPAPRGGTYQSHVPVRIIALMSNGDWTISHWIEREQRWNMFSKDHPPKGWCVPPAAPPGDA